jgi:hypothetical protein
MREKRREIQAAHHGAINRIRMRDVRCFLLQKMIPRPARKIRLIVVGK